jgi:SagB-type dehydrogenase family enzyme
VTNGRTPQDDNATDAGPRLRELWSLREDTVADIPQEASEPILIQTRWGDVRLDDPSSEVREALRRMSYGPVSLDNVLPGFSGPAQAGRPADPRAARLREAMVSLQHVTVRSLATAGGVLLSVVPVSAQATFAPQRPHPVRHLLRLSRFAQLRVADDGLLLESPLAHHRVMLRHPDACRIAALLARPSTARGIASWRDLPEPDLLDVLAYLVTASVVVTADADGGGGFAEDDDPMLTAWSPYDLMTHARSRLGRHDQPVGAAFAGRRPTAPGPVAKLASGGPRHLLPRADVANIVADDPPLAAVMEARRSVRRYGQSPMTVRQLGELLYRVARIRSLAPPGADGPDQLASGIRPYPSLGSSYALELYLVVHECAGLAPGAYHYAPLEHALEQVHGAPGAEAELLEQAQISAGLTGPPPVLVVVTARFRRVAATYRALAYSSLLKEVGVLQQTFYLACTAMRLAPCALASGDSDASAEAFGLDWACESSIGEFIFGPWPGDDEAPAID